MSAGGKAACGVAVGSASSKEQRGSGLVAGILRDDSWHRGSGEEKAGPPALQAQRSRLWPCCIPGPCVLTEDWQVRHAGAGRSSLGEAKAPLHATPNLWPGPRASKVPRALLAQASCLSREL